MAKQARKLFRPVDRVICAHSLDQKQGLLALPPNYFDHTITDPPYSEWVHAKKMSGSSGGAVSTPVTFDALTMEELQTMAFEIVRTTSGWALIFCADDDMLAWRSALVAAGAMRGITCIWTKPNGTPQFRGEGPSQPCEHFVTAWCGEGRPVWNGGGKMGHYICTTEPAATRRHETQKPLRLMKNLVLDFTMPGQLISDPYGGGGTTGMAARVTGRRYVLWEVKKSHAEDSHKWIRAASEQLDIERLYHRVRGPAFGDEPPSAPEQSEMDLCRI